MIKKLSSHRGQGILSLYKSLAQLDYFQVADKCISRVYTCTPDIKQNEATKACEESK